MYSTADKYFLRYSCDKSLQEEYLGERNFALREESPESKMQRIIRKEPESCLEYGGRKLVRNNVPINTSAPDYWGSAFWKSLHLSAFHYPDEASALVNNVMQNRILALPYEIPCATCRHHCMAYIDSNRSNLSKICSSKAGLFKFYVDFHNAVNKRKGKPEMSLEIAYKLYSGEFSLV